MIVSSEFAFKPGLIPWERLELNAVGHGEVPWPSVLQPCPKPENLLSSLSCFLREWRQMLHYTRGRRAFPQPYLCSSCCHFSLALRQGWLSKPLGQIADFSALVAAFCCCRWQRWQLEQGKRSWARPLSCASPGKGSSAAELLWGRAFHCSCQLSLALMPEFHT